MIDLRSLRPWARPEITGIGRLPMRPRLVPYTSVREAMATDTLDRGATVDLNGVWDFRLFPSPESAVEWVEEYLAGERPGEAYGAGVADGARDAARWRPITVPGNWTVQGWDHPHYTNIRMPFPESPPEPPTDNPTGLYRRRFAHRPDVDERWPRAVLHIGGAESVAIVWLDGAFIGLTKDTRLESEFDVTASKTQPNRSGGPNQGAEHELLIMVVRYSDASFIEDQDQWWMAGLYRDVYIRREPAVYPKQLRLRPVLADDNRTGRLIVEVELGGVEALPGAESRPTRITDVEVALYDAPGDLLNDPGAGVGIPADEGGPSGGAGEIEGRGAPAVGFPSAIAGISGRCSGAPATDGHMHRSPNRADRLRLGTPALAVHPWSGESPYLYTVTITLRDGGAAGCANGPAVDRARPAPIIAVYRRQIGFRRSEIENGRLLINGRPVMIHGANRHEHDPDTGKTVTRESMIRDLELLRRFNFNAVRTAHYPNHPDWYDLCDRYGVYLWDEANIEAHHYYNEICRDSRYTAAFVDRVQRMIQRDFDHPSVVVWSLGNESGYGPNHDAVAGWVRSVDPSRPLHYEGAVRTEWGQDTYDLRRGRTVTDIIAPMYAPVGEISRWAKREGMYRDIDSADERPLILCEYSHAMGNSNGGLADYYAAFRALPRLQGGFIWDWVDQGLRTHTADGREFWAYGGDFGDTPTDRDFCINGLIAPDRTVHPGIREFRKLAQEWRLEPRVEERADGRTVSVALRSGLDFAAAEGYTLHWRYTIDGGEPERLARGGATRGSIPIPSIPVDETVVLPIVALPAPVGADERTGEEILTVEITRDAATALTGANHEVAWEQWELANLDAAVPAIGWGGAPHVLASRDRAHRAPPLALSIAGGAPVLSRDGEMIDGPELTIWRAPTENDYIREMPDQDEKPGRRWMDWGLNMLDGLWRTVGDDSATIRLVGTYCAPDGRKRAEISLSLATDDGHEGWYALRVAAVIDPEIRDLPRIGLRFTLPAGFEQLRWYGRGPWENYPDRSTGYPVGVWESTVTDQYVPYIVPQEHGGRSGVRWIELSDTARGVETRRLIVASAAGNTFHASALHTAPEDLDTAAHTTDVVTRPETILIVDHFHRGIGTGACGPDCDPRWIRGGGRYEWTWHLRG